MSEGKSWVDKAVQLTSSKKRGSLYHQEAIEEPIISFQKAGDRPPMVSGVSNSSYSFDSPINYRVSYAANGRSTRKVRFLIFVKAILLSLWLRHPMLQPKVIQCQQFSKPDMTHS